MRLDLYLFHHGLAQSRQKAQELIQSQSIYLNGKPCLKSSMKITQQDRVESRAQQQWVSRSAQKLHAFLSTHPHIQIEKRRVLDIGASTGGFAQVLLNYGASEVVCVDVGDKQLHPQLRNHPKIICFENQDIRTFKSAAFEFVVCDVSFISLRLLLGKIKELTQKECILLFKPQFEVGKEAKRNKKGVLQDLKDAQTALMEFLDFVQKMGFALQECQKSQVKGKNGNEEFFIHLHRS